MWCGSSVCVRGSIPEAVLGRGADHLSLATCSLTLQGQPSPQLTGDTQGAWWLVHTEESRNHSSLSVHSHPHRSPSLSSTLLFSPVPSFLAGVQLLGGVCSIKHLSTLILSCPAIVLGFSPPRYASFTQLVMTLLLGGLRAGVLQPIIFKIIHFVFI